MAEVPGKIGKYEILSVLGEGGMGIVYKGRDPLIDRAVAIKTIRLGGDAAEPELVQRLTMEARSAGRLHHPNIVTIYEFGHQEGLAYLVMEYVEGRNLETIIRARSAISLGDKIGVIIQTTQGLAYAHELGVTHRDIKPANVCLTTRGTPKILDFGLARLDETRLTKTGFVTGTVAYMSPERLKGETGPGDDIFALGALAYELLTYHKAFPGKTFKEIATRIVSEDPRSVADVAGLPSSLDPILRKAMARDRANRYQTAHEFARDLDVLRNSSEFASWATLEKSRASFESLDSVIQRPIPGMEGHSAPYTGPEPVSPATESTDLTPMEGVAGATLGHQAVSSPEDSADASGRTEIRAVPPRPPLATDGEAATVQVEAFGGTEPTALDLPALAKGVPPGKDEPRVEATRTRWGKTVAPGARETQARDEAAEKTLGPGDAQMTERVEPSISGPTQLVSSLKSLPLRARTLMTRAFGEKEPKATRVSAEVAPEATGRTLARRWRQSGPVEVSAQPTGKEAPREESVEPPAREIDRRGIIAVGIVGLLIFGIPMAFRAGGIPAYVVLYALAAGAWVWLIRSVEKTSLRVVLAGAILLRALVLFHEPGLSDEVFRYAWDGQVSSANSNPYVVAPSDPSLESHRDSSFERLESPDQVSRHPAWAEIVFWIWAGLGGGLLLWRCFLLVVDVGVVWLLWDEKNPRRSVAYATFPLVILEGIWNGHVEIVTGALLLAACISLRKDHEGTASFAVALATGTTIFAGAAVPAVLEGAGRFLKMIVVLGATLVLGALFFGFQGGITTPLRIFGEESPQILFLRGALAERFEATGVVDSIRNTWASVAGEKFPAILERMTSESLAGAVLVVLLFVLAAVVARWTFTFERGMTNAVGVIVVFFLLVQPWYWLTIAPVAILASQPLWIFIALFSPLLYLSGVKAGAFWLIYGIAYGVPIVLAAGQRIRKPDGETQRPLFDFSPPARKKK